MNRHHRRARRPLVESLEGRALMATFLVESLNDAGAGSLRQAILDANAAPGRDAIVFSIGTNAQTIRPLSPLPAITGPVDLDARTQPGYTQFPLIELDGSAAGPGANGLWLATDGSTVLGLVINRFSGSGIVLQGDRNLVAGNYLGTDAGGTAALGNGGSGLAILGGSNNVVGTVSAGGGNLISGNAGDGVTILGTAADPATGNVIQDDFLGTNAPGTAALPNGGAGVRIVGSGGNFVGGAAIGARNLISGNRGSGVVLQAGDAAGATAGNVVAGNLIGVNLAATAPLGNAGPGVLVALDPGTASGTVVGGTTTGSDNIIAFNGGPGVSVRSGSGVSVLSNTIYGNAGLGIDVGDDGPTPNDPGDADSGPNGLQNAPVITRVDRQGPQTLFQGVLDALPNTRYTVQFFSEAIGAGGTTEGLDLIGQTVLTTDAKGRADFLFAAIETLPASSFIAATATGPDGSTSELSRRSSIGPRVVDVNTVPHYGTIEGVILTFDGDLDKARAETLSRYRLRVVGGGSIRVVSASYNEGARTVTLRVKKHAPDRVFVRVTATGLTDALGNPIDGNGDGVPDGKYDALVGLGPRLQYRESDGDLVRLGIRGPRGLVEVVRDLSGDARQLRVRLARPGNVLFGSVARSRRGDGRAIIPVAYGLNTVRNTLTNPPFVIGSA